MSGRRRLPPALTGVGGGLVIGGITAYAFLVGSARALGPRHYAPLSALWALVLVLGSGAFMPLEQEVSRAVAARAVHGAPAGPVARRALLVGGALCLVLAVALVGAASPLADRVFDGESLMATALALALVGYLAQFVARGLLAGLRRYFPYGRLLAAEGVVRLLGCSALVVAGSRSPVPYGLVVGVAPLLALAAVPSLARLAAEPGTPAPLAEVTTAFAYLLGASLCSQVLVNAGPAAVQWLASPAESDAAGRFLAALIVSRLPLFFYGAVQASVLPRLSGYAAQARTREFNALLRRAAVAVLVAGAAATLGAFLVGPSVLSVAFGPDYRVGRLDVAVLATTTTALMLTMTVAQGLIAVQRYAKVAFGWLLGAVTFAAMLMWDGAAVARVERAMLAGSAVALAALGAATVGLVRRTWPPVSAETVVPTGSMIET